MIFKKYFLEALGIVDGGLLLRHEMSATYCL
jgi:hypothetical protein